MTAFAIIVYETHMNSGSRMNISILSVKFMNTFFGGSCNMTKHMSSIWSSRVICWQSLSVTFLFWIRLNAAPLFKECCLLGDFTINRNKYFQQKWREIILPLNHGEFYSCFIWLFKRKSVISMRLVCNNTEPRFFLKGSPEQ